jgi:hypothetical protein
MRRGGIHVGQHRRVGHQALQRRLEERQRLVRQYPAAGEDPGEDVVHLVALGHGERAGRSFRIQPLDPAAAGDRALDAEECTVGGLDRQRGQSPGNGHGPRIPQPLG